MFALFLLVRLVKARTVFSVAMKKHETSRMEIQILLALSWTQKLQTEAETCEKEALSPVTAPTGWLWTPAARLVRAASDQLGSSILCQVSRRVMLLGNGTLTLPIMQQAQKPEKLSCLPPSARKRRWLSGSTCGTSWLGFDCSAVPVYPVCWNTLLDKIQPRLRPFFRRHSGGTTVT